MKRGMALLLTVVGLAGCVEPQTNDIPDRLPDDWDQGVALEGHNTWVYHSGTHGAWLYPQESDPGLPVPVACVAYRDGRAVARDTCSVMGGSDRHLGEVEPRPWGIDVEWVHSSWRSDDYGDAVAVAYDASGNAIAWWGGALHANATAMTE